MVDVVAVVGGPLRRGTDTPATIRLSGGGSAANTAAWIGVQGATVALLAAVGDDDLGATARAELAGLGVDHLGPVVAGAATGTCVVLVDPTGERTMLPDRAANDHLAVADVDAAWAGTGVASGTGSGGPDVEAALDGTRPVGRVHLSGYTLLSVGSRPAGVALLARARAAGWPVSVDAASAGPLADLGGAAFLDLVAPVDLLFANEDEVAALGGEAAALGVARALVVKRGAAGATWTDGTERVERPAEPGPVVDTTGAGDALAAGFLAATHGGASPAAALASGTAVAARAVAGVGARPGTVPAEGRR